MAENNLIRAYNVTQQTSTRAHLAPVILPAFGASAEEPTLPSGEYARRLDAFMARLSSIGADCGVVYADREHCANLLWLTGFEPRFEEALMVVRPNHVPMLLTGPENVGVAAAAPLSLEVQLYPPMGLMGQDRRHTKALADILADSGVGSGMKVACAGWKYFSLQETPTPGDWLELPAYIVDTLRHLVGSTGRVFNGGEIFMDPGSGLRSSNSIDELARYEFAACHTSEAVKRVIKSAQPGLREYEVAAALTQNGMPQTCHPMFSSGERAWFGLLSPSSKQLQRGEAVTTAYGVRGALNCRAGWLAEDAGDLPEPARDYIDALVAPYFDAVADWLETIRIGLPGGDLDALIKARLGDPFFRISLNPGHLIHLEEWMHTPISPGSTTPFRTGMAVQMDIIPATGGPYFTTNAEDGIALLDSSGRAAFAEKYPDAMERIRRRKSFMADVLGIHLNDDCLPFSNIPGWLPPFWLANDMAMTRK